MNKVLAMVLGIAFSCGILSMSFAETPSGTNELTKKQEDTFPSKHRMREPGCFMAPMMPCLMSNSLLETKDGGLIVMAGNKLMKYDKDLNLVKEVEVKIDMEGMRKGMMQMMEGCPKHKMFMKEGGLPEKAPAPKTE